MRHTVIDFMKKCGVISEDKNQMLVELGQGIKGDGLTEVRGSLDFIEVLNLYPSFVEGARNFKKRNSGRPTANPSPREVEYLVYLVEKLYLDNGRVYTRDDRRKLKEMLNRAVDGADFFDPVKSKHWIDMFSALDHTLHFFSPEGDERFAVFFTHYVSFYSKLNTKKIVPFYARWIKEIAAMYTVYLNGTFNEFEGIRDALQSALVDGMSNTPCERDLRYRTDAVRNYIMTNIFVAYEKDKKTVLSKLCDYIRENPSEFVYESGELNSRYRRYYCVLKEMIVWITRQDVMQLADDELIEIFTNDSIDYDLKDKRVRDLEFQIVSNIILLCREKNYSKQYKDGVEPGGLYPINNSLVIEFLVKERAKLDDKTASQIVIEIDEMPFERVRTVEEVVDSIVKLLRLSVMLIVAHKGLSADNNEYEVPPPEDVIDDIDQMMKNFGLLPLPARTTKSYNKKSYIDLCVVRFVEDVFDE